LFTKVFFGPNNKKRAELYQTHFEPSEAEVPLEGEQSTWQEEGRGVQPKGAERRGFPFGAGLSIQRHSERVNAHLRV